METATVKGLDLIGNPAEGRPQMGPMVPVALFRALRLIGIKEGLDATIGNADTLVYSSGKGVGIALGASIIEKTGNKDLNKYVGAVTDTVKELGIGLLVVTKLDLENNFLSLKVDECVTCAGMPNIGQILCHFESGMISGILETFTEKRCDVKEVKCYGNGDDTCEFNVYIS